MDNNTLARLIDHTLLSPTATWPQIETLCRQTLTYGAASACVPPSYVARIRAQFPKLTLCTVLGFPLGYTAAQAKRAEAVQAIRDGADELDMVVNLTHVKNGDWDAVRDELAAMRETVGGKTLKIIVETCCLTRAEKVALCRLVSETGADFIKTSTGFGAGGAALDDIALFQENIAPTVRIKAAGGIRTAQDVQAFAAAGCHRIGSSGALLALSKNVDIKNK